MRNAYKIRRGTLQGKRLLWCWAELEGTVQMNLRKIGRVEIDLIQSLQERFHYVFFLLQRKTEFIKLEDLLINSATVNFRKIVASFPMQRLGFDPILHSATSQKNLGLNFSLTAFRRSNRA
jgi:hypothetical protein